MNTYATSRTSSSEYAWKIFTTNEISDKALVARQAISVTCYEAGELETEFRILLLRYSVKTEQAVADAFLFCFEFSPPFVILSLTHILGLRLS